MSEDKSQNRFYFQPACRMPQCRLCRYYFRASTCEAFPNGIPDEVYWAKDDARHDTEKLKEPCGDTDLHFEAKES